MPGLLRGMNVGGHMAISEDALQEVIANVAVATFTYYPEIHIDAPEFDLMGAAAACLEPVRAAIPAETGDALIDLIARTIIDPTKYREEALDTLMELAPEE